MPWSWSTFRYRYGGGSGELDRLAHVDEVLRLVRELDRVLGLDLRAGDVEAAAVHHDVAVTDELAGLPLGESEPQTEDDRVQTRLELADQLLAGDPALRLARS